MICKRHQLYLRKKKMSKRKNRKTSQTECFRLISGTHLLHWILYCITDWPTLRRMNSNMEKKIKELESGGRRRISHKQPSARNDGKMEKLLVVIKSPPVDCRRIIAFFARFYFSFLSLLFCLCTYVVVYKK